MNDIIFSNGFMFRTLEFKKFHYTDNRAGAPSHYFAYMLCGNCKITTKSATVKINEGDIFLVETSADIYQHAISNQEGSITCGDSSSRHPQGLDPCLSASTPKM